MNSFASLSCLSAPQRLLLEPPRILLAQAPYAGTPNNLPPVNKFPLAEEAQCLLTPLNSCCSRKTSLLAPSFSVFKSQNWDADIQANLSTVKKAIKAETRTQLLLLLLLLLQVTMGDILSDLPAVGNFTFAEHAQYASKPNTPSQLWLRRQPKPWQASRADR